MIDLNRKPYKDELQEFVEFTANLLHESTGPFFRGPKSKGYPVDEQALRENADVVVTEPLRTEAAR